MNPLGGERRTYAPQGRRSEDRPPKHRRIAILRENWYRDVWLIIISGLVLLALARASDEREAQLEGRRTAVEAVCGATSAVVQAGQATITGGGAGIPEELSRFLERHGYPPKSVREEQAKLAAEAYAKNVSKQIEKNSGLTGIVRENGTLDCEKMVEAALAQ